MKLGEETRPGSLSPSEEQSVVYLGEDRHEVRAHRPSMKAMDEAQLLGADRDQALAWRGPYGVGCNSDTWIVEVISAAIPLREDLDSEMM